MGMSTEDVENSDDETEPERGCQHVFHRVKDWRATVDRYLVELVHAWPGAVFRVVPKNGVAVDARPGDQGVQLPDTGSLIIAKVPSLLRLYEEKGVVHSQTREGPIVLDFRAEGPNVACLSSPWIYAGWKFGAVRRPASTTTFVWDGNDLVHELRDDAPAVTWVFEPDTFAPMAKIEGHGTASEKRWGVTVDHLGTPIALVDEAGKLAWRGQLDAFGVLRTDVATADCRWRWPGQYEDEETGLYYNRFRYYDPASGRYNSQDPIGLVGGAALFGYVLDPTYWIDPLGLNPPPVPPKVRRFVSKAEWNELKRHGFTFDPTDRRGGLSATSIHVDPKNPDMLRRSTGALGATHFVDIRTAGLRVEFKGITKGRVYDWKIKSSFGPDQIDAVGTCARK